MSMHLIVTRYVWTCGPGGGMAVVMMVILGVVVAVLGVVLRTFWWDIFRWPLAVGIDFGRCFLMSFDDKPGQVRYAER